MAWLRSFLAVMAILVGVNPLKAGSAGLVIKDPVPSELRERVADLLRIMRPADAAAAIDATRIIDGALWRQFGMLILRVEADCRDDLCMTVVTRVKENGLIPMACEGDSACCAAGRLLIRLRDQESSPWPGSPSPAPI